MRLDITAQSWGQGVKLPIRLCLKNIYQSSDERAEISVGGEMLVGPSVPAPKFGPLLGMPSILNFVQSEAHADLLQGRLPSWNEVSSFLNGKKYPAVYGADTWIPAYNRQENWRHDWVQIGDSRIGWSHRDRYGYPSWGSNNNYASYRGRMFVLPRDTKIVPTRGINAVMVAPTGEVLKVLSYDTHGYSEAATQILSDISQLKDGTYLVLAVKGQLRNHVVNNGALKSMIATFGSSHVQNLGGASYDSFALIGWKGAASGSVPEDIVIGGSGVWLCDLVCVLLHHPL